MWDFLRRLMPSRPMPAWARNMEKRIMSKTDEQFQQISDTIDGIATTLDTVLIPEVAKISGESTQLIQEITDLKANPPSGLTTDQQAKLDSIVARVTAIKQSADSLAAGIKAVDDLVPDAAPPGGGDTGGQTDQGGDTGTAGDQTQG